MIEIQYIVFHFLNKIIKEDSYPLCHRSKQFSYVCTYQIFQNTHRDHLSQYQASQLPFQRSLSCLSRCLPLFCTLLFLMAVLQNRLQLKYTTTCFYYICLLTQIVCVCACTHLPLHACAQSTQVEMRRELAVGSPSAMRGLGYKHRLSGSATNAFTC